jgi:gas vesicle protein
MSKTTNEKPLSETQTLRKEISGLKDQIKSKEQRLKEIAPKKEKVKHVQTEVEKFAKSASNRVTDKLAKNKEDKIGSWEEFHKMYNNLPKQITENHISKITKTGLEYLARNGTPKKAPEPAVENPIPAK